MTFRSSACGVLLTGLCLLPLAACNPPARSARLHPAPVESEESEGKIQRSRAAWEELLHSAPPGVSWREIETRNRHRNLAARAAMLAGRAAAPAGTWRERGSFDQSGRTHAVAVGGDGKTLFIATDRGGIFSGLPGGQRWIPRSDGLGIGARFLAIVPGRPAVWIVSGEVGPLYVSTNAGATWAPAVGGPAFGEGVTRVLRDPARPRSVYALVYAGAVYKLYRSDDGGLHFAVVSSGPLRGTPDLWMDRLHGGPLYLAIQKEIRKSTDRGATFKRAGRLPATAGNDVRLVGSEAGAPTLYAAARSGNSSSWSLFVSENAGRTWQAGSQIPFFWGGLNASITNPRLVFVGGVDTYRSTDAGRTLQIITRWTSYYEAPDTNLHADVPGIDVLFYRGKESVFFNTDGGTFVSEDGGRTVRNITRHGLGNSQYYGILTSVNDSNLIAAGAQDQGYQVSRPSSRAVLAFDQVIGGDYGSLTSSDGSHDMLYSSYPGSILVQIRERSAEVESIQFPPPPAERRQFWIAPLAADPDDPAVVYYGDRRIWRVERNAPYDYDATPLPHDFGPEADADYLGAFALSPADHDRWYAGSVRGRLWHSSDRGQTWTQDRQLEHVTITEVLPSPTDPDVCYAAGSGYPHGISVYRTTDGGATWEPYAEGLPQTLVRALAFADPGGQELYAATDAGPFRYDETAGAWESLLGTQAPLTLYTDVEGVPAAGVVRFATFGRGIWDYTPGR
jgi:photosystem II stability/assembly factor-like uncharacterized protein